MLKKIIGGLLLTAAALSMPVTAHPKVVPGPPPPNLNKTVSDLCDQMYASSGDTQLAYANEILTDIAGYYGSLSGYDKQCIQDAYVIVYG